MKKQPKHFDDSGGRKKYLQNVSTDPKNPSYVVKPLSKRGRPTSYAFASNRHQRPAGTLLFFLDKDTTKAVLKAAGIGKLLGIR